MTKLAAIWEFIAGESRLGPLGLAFAFLVALVLLRVPGVPGALVGAVFAALVAGALAASVFERT
jgi:hypothetical protein